MKMGGFVSNLDDPLKLSNCDGFYIPENIRKKLEEEFGKNGEMKGDFSIEIQIQKLDTDTVKKAVEEFLNTSKN